MAVNLVPHNGVLHIKMMSVGGYRLSCMDMNTFAVVFHDMSVVNTL